MKKPEKSDLLLKCSDFDFLVKKNVMIKFSKKYVFYKKYLRDFFVIIIYSSNDYKKLAKKHQCFVL